MLRIDYKAAKDILGKNVKNLASKHICKMASPIKMYNKGKKLYEPDAIIAPELSKYDLSSTQGQLSHIFTCNDSYKSLDQKVIFT